MHHGVQSGFSCEILFKYLILHVFIEIIRLDYPIMLLNSFQTKHKLT